MHPSTIKLCSHFRPSGSPFPQCSCRRNEETIVVQVTVPCPLCNQPAQVTVSFDSPSIYKGACERCGHVWITEEAVAEAERLGKRHIISAWCRRIQSEFDVSLIKRLDIATIISDTPEYSVLEKLDRTLEAIAVNTSQPGQRTQFTAQNDYPLVYAASPQEPFFTLGSWRTLVTSGRNQVLPRFWHEAFNAL